MRKKMSLLTLSFFIFFLTASIGISNERFISNKKGKIPNPWKDYNSKQDEIITDTETGLMWKKEYEHSFHDMTYSKVMNFVKELTLGNYNDWRLATVDELRTICLTRDYSYNIFDYPRSFDFSRATFRTSEEIAPYFVKEYLPYSDTFVIENKYSTENFVELSVVNRSNSTIKYPGDHHHFTPDAKIEKFIKADGFAYFKVYPHPRNPTFSDSWLIPEDMEKYKYLTFCPANAIAFLGIEKSYLEQLSIEDNFKKNNIYYIRNKHVGYDPSALRLDLWSMKRILRVLCSF